MATTEGAAKFEDNLKYRPNTQNLEDSDHKEIADDASDDESNADEDLEDEEGNLSQSSEGESKLNARKAFKAAKSNPVFYEDRATKKQKREDERKKKKMSKSDYVEELRREMMDEPEEVHLGNSKKTKFSKE